MPTADGFSIGYVSLRTGLSTHVIRAWERRYQAVTPQRSASGRRLFSQADVERLELLKRLLGAGHSISTIAGLDDRQLIGLAGDVSAAEPPPADEPSPLPPPPTCRPAELVRDCLVAVQGLDADALHRKLQAGLLLMSRPAFLNTVIMPLMEHVGRQWAEGSLRIVHGHLAAVVVHAHLVGMLRTCIEERVERPGLLIGTPAGQRCYLGALAVAVIAQDHGWKPMMVGYNLPAEEMAAACSLLAPRLVAMSVTCRVDDAFTLNELQRLSDLIDGRCPLIIGGQACHFYRRQMDALGGTVCTTIKALISQLNQS